jgi:hypothetical protein
MYDKCTINILYNFENFIILTSYIKTSIIADIATIDKSSTIVTVDMGKLNTSPKQAHLIFCLSKTLRMTPILLIPSIKMVATFVKMGAIFIRNRMPNNNSTNGYM